MLNFQSCICEDSIKERFLCVRSFMSRGMRERTACLVCEVYVHLWDLSSTCLQFVMYCWCYWFSCYQACHL